MTAGARVEVIIAFWMRVIIFTQMILIASIIIIFDVKIMSSPVSITSQLRIFAFQRPKPPPKRRPQKYPGHSWPDSPTEAPKVTPSPPK
jgi:hypothetical protein